MGVKFSTTYYPKNDFVKLDVVIEEGILPLEKLAETVDKAPEVSGDRGICISGRLPVWLFTALAHKYHYTRFVAVYEPRVNACVVVASHWKDRKVGDILPLE